MENNPYKYVNSKKPNINDSKDELINNKVQSVDSTSVCSNSSFSNINCDTTKNNEEKNEDRSNNHDKRKNITQADFKNVLNMQKELSNTIQPKILTESCNTSKTSSEPAVVVKQITKNRSTIIIKPLQGCSKSRLLVRINRIKAEDVRNMQQSIKEFIKKSPELAKKMCLLPTDTTNDVKTELEDIQSEEIHQPTQPENVIIKENVSEGGKLEVLEDTFNIMKAHEKVSQKRKIPISFDDIPHDQICK